MIGCYTHVQSPRGPIIWHPDSKGFYYHGSFGIYNQLLYYSLLDYSIKALTNQFRDFADESEEWLNSKWFGRALKRLDLVVN